MTRYVVVQGECILSIAKRHGFHWKTLWDHPDNGGLKSNRSDPGVLNPGDEVAIPDLRPREEAAEDGRQHRFLRKGIPAMLHLRILDTKGKARSGVRYVLEVDGNLTDGTTDGEGRIKVPIPPAAAAATIEYEDEEGFPVRHRLTLGGVDPDTGNAGIRKRLANLGYCTTEDEEGSGGGLERAIRAFQETQGMEPTGRLDDATRQALSRAHGS